jgi:hypothetical protein
MDQAAVARATHEHAGSLIASPPKRLLQGYGRLGEAKVALER